MFKADILIRTSKEGDMPHARLLDTSVMSVEAAELTRARIHYRSGKDRLKEGKTHEGLSTLFDAFQSALRWYVASPGRLAELEFREGDDLNDEKVICAVLKRSGVLDKQVDYDVICDAVERALDGDLTGVDAPLLERTMDAALNALGIVPFDFAELPPKTSEAA